MKLLREFEVRRLLPESPFEIQNFGINVYFKQWIELKARKNN